MRSSWRYWGPLAVVCSVVVVVAVADTGGERAQPSRRTDATTVGVTHEQHPRFAQWLAFGGGMDPASNQVSIEQDLALVAKLLGRQGLTLFAGGSGKSPVQVLTGSERRGREGGLHRRLGDLFWPQQARSARYRPTRLALHGDARAETVLHTMLDALEQPVDEALFVFVAAHGDPGEHRHENLVRLWGGAPISVVDMGELLDELPKPRPLRLVMASCFSGGFAELAFAGARSDRGATDVDRCGLFATTWDAPAAGCDPNPDRRAQESYFLHLLNALQGQDRDGNKAAIDLDGDGKVSLSEGHTRVRIASHSISVPTTTSERWLRHAAARITKPAREAPPTELVEERAVLAALGQTFELDGLVATARRLTALRGQARDLEGELQRLQLVLEVAGADLRIALLERWPVLDDAYHPRYRDMLENNERAIRGVLDASLLAEGYEQASVAVQRRERALDMLDVEMAMVRRLSRAHENMAAAAKLRDHDEVAYARFMKFLHCERSLPPSSREPTGAKHAEPR